MMSHQENKPGDEKMVVSHDAVKGYRPVFYICITLGVLYLALILVETL